MVAKEGFTFLLILDCLVGLWPSVRDHTNKGESINPIRNTPETVTCWIATTGVGNLNSFGKCSMLSSSIKSTKL
ncbi:hypothetical protein BY996DRAFT_6843934 [Phakopsora pachyrhizi]|nr:hypothetical protein BY996DRAFT_6843934 [Phakopsora pachyrhizi]